MIATDGKLTRTFARTECVIAIDLLMSWSSVWSPQRLLAGLPDADDAADMGRLEFTGEEKSPSLYGCKGLDTGSVTSWSLLTTASTSHHTASSIDAANLSIRKLATSLHRKHF